MQEPKRRIRALFPAEAAARRYFARYLKRYAGREALLVLLMLLGSAGGLVPPYVLKVLIDRVFPAGDYSLLLGVLGVYMGVSILRIGIASLSAWMSESVGNRIMKDLRADIFRRLVRLPVDFYDKSRAGDVMHRINSEVNSIQSVLTGSFPRILNSVCTVAGLIVMLCLLNGKLFLVSAAVFPFIWLNTRYFQPRIRARIREGRRRDALVLDWLMERLSHVRLIKSYVRYGFEERKLEKLLDRQIAVNMKQVGLTSATRGITLFFSYLVPALIFCIGGRDVMTGLMTLGSLVAFIQYMNRLFDPFRDLMGVYFDLTRASVSMERIWEVVRLPAEDDGKGGAFVPGDIEFEHVYFRYGENRVLEDFDLRLEAGKKYALVGPSGCGKSTVLKLLCRYYIPQRGAVRIGGRDLGTIALDRLRERIAYVDQDTPLFHGTIRYNIGYGGPDRPAEDLRRAAALSGVAEVVERLPGGYASVAGDRGVRLSGGQKQRIALARFLLKEADILLLDEATSALDRAGEKEMLERLFRLYRNKTLLLVTHRLSAVEGVDEVIRLEGGRVVWRGPYAEAVKDESLRPSS